MVAAAGRTLSQALDLLESDLGLTEDDLLNDVDYSVGQALAAAAVELGFEGMLVPSATRLGDNLIDFPHLVRSDTVLVAVRSIDLHLVK
ncbi:MAG: hypothetical protein QOF01_4518 [Thermomicrobiales bacterium]|nr:hypothetical protein [Thermomicrobiales bacterium]